jgi:hypothetical protein
MPTAMGALGEERGSAFAAATSALLAQQQQISSVEGHLVVPRVPSQEDYASDRELCGGQVD